MLVLKIGFDLSSLANFALPVEGTLFDKVDYVEQNKEEANKIVESYNKEGKNAIPPMEKRFRGNDRYGACISSENSPIYWFSFISFLIY